MTTKLPWTSFLVRISFLAILTVSSCAPAQEDRAAMQGDSSSAGLELAQQITPGGPTTAPNSGVAYDFVANVCTAVWFSGAGQLPCPGADGDAKGVVLRVDSPKLETGAADARPSLLNVPQNVQDGYIQGFYPPFRVQSGDRFRATTSCESGARDCYAAYRLDYQIGSDPIRSYWGPFLERYEGQVYSVDVDLSALAGQDVKFILTVLAAGIATGDRPLWINPVLVRQAAPVVTVSGTPPTATQSATPATVLPSACDKAQFVADVTIPDGTVLQPGVQFTKTWRLKNVGTCTWSTAYQITFANGEQMGAAPAAAFPANVAPGQTIDLSVSLITPTFYGKFRGNWMLKNANGRLFGIGDNAATPIWVDIAVAGASATPTYTPGASATPTPTPPATNTATPTPPTPASATPTFTPDPVDNQAVRQASELSPQFSRVFGIQINSSLAKGLDAGRIGGQPGQLAGMIAPVIDENQKYRDRSNLIREVEGIFTINDSRLTAETAVMINKADYEYPLLPVGSYLLACYTPRMNDCVAVSLQGQEFQIRPDSIIETRIDPAPFPTVAYEEGSIRKCFRVLRRKICMRVFR